MTTYAKRILGHFLGPRKSQNFEKFKFGGTQKNPTFYCWAFAVWTGLEPATPAVTGQYSNQLNYHTVLVLRSAKINEFILKQKNYAKIFSDSKSRFLSKTFAVLFNLVTKSLN